ASPMRARRYGGRPSMRSPRNEIVPESASWRPQIVSNRVVLPAPFGPISATMPARAITRSTPSRAAMPPKRLRRLSTSSRFGTVPEPVEQAEHAARCVKREQDQQQPEDEQPGARCDPQHFRDGDEQQRPEHGPAEIAGAAEDHDGDQVEALGQIEAGRRGHAQERDPQAAPDTGDGGRDGEDG